MPKKCFVVMGFGAKTDPATGRTLDLDKTYRIIIKKAVEDSGFECIRADDVIHAGPIDTPMYELLLEADVVIADLSTSNANAIYELGVRHALRPHTTIVIAEKQFRFPFDLGHLLIHPYEHLGVGIDAEEAERVRGDLKRALETVQAKPSVDSPVYTFLPRLRAWNVLESVGVRDAQVGQHPTDETFSLLMEMFREARAKSDWSGAVKYLMRLVERCPSDPYLKQRLALAIYRSKEPDIGTALAKAKGILQDLQPQTTTDPETLGLWGAVHEGLWQVGKNRADLDEAIWAHEKGFYLKNDRYNGLNLAFLLNVRAAISPSREAIADVVTAERVRRRVIKISEELLRIKIRDDHGKPDPVETFWVQAYVVEALMGIGETARAAERRAGLNPPEAWMAGALNERLGKLEVLLAAAPV